MRFLRPLLRTARPFLGLAGGLALVGLSGYAFMVAVGQVYNLPTGMDPSSGTAAGLATSKAALTNFYFLVTTVIMGVYAGLDQTTNRRIAHTLAQGSALRPAVLRAVRDAVWLTSVVGVLLVAASPVLVGRTLKDQLGLFCSILAGIVMAATASVARGILAGSQRFIAYGVVWAAEGTTRLLLIAVAVFAGQKSTWVYGYVYVVPFLVSAGVGLVACRSLRLREVDRAAVAAADAAGHEGSSASMGLAALSTAGLMTTAVGNLPQLILGSRILATDPAGVAFGQAFLLARVALTALTPFQSMLLPRFTHEAATGHFHELRRLLRFAMWVCGGAGVLWAVLVIAAGPWTLRTVFGTPPADVPALLVFAALGGGTILFAIASAVQPALVAVGRYRTVPIIWASGVVATVVGAFWPGLRPIDAATAAAIAGPSMVLIAMAIAGRAGIFHSDGAADASSGADAPDPAVVSLGTATGGSAD